jgi:hypothetical protein
MRVGRVVRTVAVGVGDVPLCPSVRIEESIGTSASLGCSIVGEKTTNLA